MRRCHVAREESRLRGTIRSTHQLCQGSLEGSCCINHVHASATSSDPRQIVTCCKASLDTVHQHRHCSVRARAALLVPIERQITISNIYLLLQRLLNRQCQLLCIRNTEI